MEYLNYGVPAEGMAGKLLTGRRTVVVEDYAAWEGRQDAPLLDRIRAAVGVT